MNLSQLVREIGELNLRGQNVQSDIKGWINRAQRAIAERRSWTFMHDRLSVTIVAGTTSASLPSNFKEPSPEKSPITFTAPNQAYPTPVHVRSREELERMTPGQFGNVVNASGAWTPFFVFFEQDAGGLWSLNVPPQFPYVADCTYALSAFMFPADLAAGTDHNGFTDSAELSEAIINWIKWKALPKTDPEGQASKQAFEETMQSYAVADARRKLSGRSLHW